MTRIFVKDTNRRIEKGHPWVYANQVLRTQGHVEPGDIVEVFDPRKGFLGRGYANPQSQILVRLLTRDPEETVDGGLIRRRLDEAWAYRQRLGYQESCRLTFGEADFLPALVIDKFGEVFSIQTLALGMEQWKDTITSWIQDTFPGAHIFERNDVPVRQREGLEEKKGFLTAPFPTRFEIQENEVRMEIDVENGQKTGYFLDQTANRAALRPIVSGAEVLDCFCYTGSFSVHAAAYGAQSVLGLDISEDAVAQATRNAQLNGLQERCRFEAVNAFDYLSEAVKGDQRFDVVILDPPAFVKSRKALDNALRGYKEINLRAMKLVRPGGFLVTCSCSHFLTPELFYQTLQQAAFDAKRTIRQVEYRTQGPDHPVLWNVDETLYLKFYILQVL